MRPRPGSSRIFVAAGEDRRSKTHARLMDAAVALFAERGIAATSVLEITIRAKVSNGTFYHYFDSKDTIVTSIYEHCSEYIGISLLNDLNRIPNPRHQIALGTIWFIRAMAINHNWGRIMMHALQEPGIFHDQTVDNISQFIKNGVKLGHFNVSVTPAFIDLYISVLAGAIRSSLEYPKNEEDVGILAAQIHLRMLGMPSRKATTTPDEALAKYGHQPSQVDLPQHLYRSPSAA